MSFIKSAINQVGRDMGKVVSNQIFKDTHSTPYRITGSSSDSNSSKRRVYKSDFEKAISFQTGHRANTLISKISAVYTVLKNEAAEYLADGYLDIYESDVLFEMMNRFNSKVDDICDVLEIDESANQKEINQLGLIIEKTNSLFKQTLIVSADGCQEKSIELEEKANAMGDLSFIKYVGLCTIWMKKYAQTGERSIGSTILANLVSLLIFPFAHLVAGLYGAVTYFGERKRREGIKSTYLRMAELEILRAEKYLEIGT